MKIQVAILVASLICNLSIHAFTTGTFNIEGSVRDKATDTDLFDAHARLLNASDSSQYAETEATCYMSIGTAERKMPVFIFQNVDRTKNYILELTHKKYELY